MTEVDTVSKDEKLSARLEELVLAYNKPGKHSWTQYLSHVSGDLTIDPSLDDFTREVKIYSLTLSNASSLLAKLSKKGVPVWRPNDYKAETFKSDSHMAKVQNHLQEIQKKIEYVEKRKDAKNKKKFSNEARKKHVKTKQLRLRESKSKKVKKSARFMRNKKRN